MNNLFVKEDVENIYYRINKLTISLQQSISDGMEHWHVETYRSLFASV